MNFQYLTDRLVLRIEQEQAADKVLAFYKKNKPYFDITAARNLLKAGAKENKKKKSLAEMDDSMFIEANSTTIDEI